MQCQQILLNNTIMLMIMVNLIVNYTFDMTYIVLQWYIIDTIGARIKLIIQIILERRANRPLPQLLWKKNTIYVFIFYITMMLCISRQLENKRVLLYFK